jgi:transposase-like protein
MNTKHHGQLIEKIIRRNGHSITDVARLTHVNRRSVYNWFNQARLKPHTIKSIGAAIQFDFTDLIPELRDETQKEITFSADHEVAWNLSNENFNWKDKYIDLLERHAKLLLQTGDGK